MKPKKNLMPLAHALVGIVLATSSAQAATVVLSKSFDGNDGNDTGPAFQQLSNGTNGTPAGSSNPSTGVILTNGLQIGDSSPNGAFGLNTSTSLDLSGYSSFTIEWDVASANIGGNNDNVTFNGWFFGVTSSTATTGAGLWSNAAESAGFLLLANDTTRGDFRFGTRTDGSVNSATSLGGTIPTAASFENGFTLSLTFNDNNTWSASSTGLSNNINLTNQALVGGQTYADLAAAVVANTSMQGNQIGYTLNSVSITAIPEPTAALLGSLAILAQILRRRR